MFEINLRVLGTINTVLNQLKRHGFKIVEQNECVVKYFLDNNAKINEVNKDNIKYKSFQAIERINKNNKYDQKCLIKYCDNKEQMYEKNINLSLKTMTEILTFFDYLLLSENNESQIVLNKENCFLTIHNNYNTGIYISYKNLDYDKDEKYIHHAKLIHDIKNYGLILINNEVDIFENININNLV